MEFSHIFLHISENYSLPLATLNQVTIWRRIRRIRKCLSKLFTLLVVLMLLWADNTVESFLFVLHQRESLSTGLLNSLKKIVCNKRGKGGKLFCSSFV
jgi:hypothetical protein